MGEKVEGAAWVILMHVGTGLRAGEVLEYDA